MFRQVSEFRESLSLYLLFFKCLQIKIVIAVKRHVSVGHVLPPFAIYNVLDNLDPKQVES